MEERHVNQLFLSVSDTTIADAAKASILKIILTPSMIRADSFLSLLGTLSRLTGQFQIVTTFFFFFMALLLLRIFLGWSMVKRICEAAVLRTFGWSR